MRNVYRIAYLEPVDDRETPKYLAPFGWAVHSVLSNEPSSKLKVVLHQQITRKEAEELEATRV